MPSSLALQIAVGTSLGVAMSAFGSLKGTIKVSDVVHRLKQQHKTLGTEISAAARLPVSNLGELNERYQKIGR
ncbi:hypothetical protein AGMMS50256_38470 [Betaproteobacteria bacterium]|nr:hypothetical protein AGMMS50256_38470 [Betaproteobacteria bacterium]